MFHRTNSMKLPSLIIWSALTGTAISTAATAATSNCNPLSLATCSLPFPSDHWTAADDSSGSGRVVQLADAPIDQRILDRLPPSLNLDTIYDQSSGFSAATAVLFELSEVSYRLIGAVGAVIRGKVLLSDFRDNADVMDYSLSEGHENWVNFRLSMPKAAKGKSVPVAIYGHGITAMKETNFLVSVANAQKGIATIAIDHPYHGSRIIPDGGYVLTMLAPEYIPQQLSMMIQSSVDHMGLLKALQTSFTSLDVYPKQPFSGLFKHIKNGDGIPDLDTTRILYQGTSLGGVLGATFLSLAPTIEDAFLHVAGVGITNILSKSMLWDLAFYKLIPGGVSGGEALVLKAAMQQELDYGDAINFVQYLHNPPRADITEKRIVVAMGVDDFVVPNEATLALGLIADLPLTGELLKPIPELQQSDDYIDGNGIMQFYAPVRIGGTLEDTLAHLSFLRPEVTAEMNKWLDSYFLAN